MVATFARLSMWIFASSACFAGAAEESCLLQQTTELQNVEAMRRAGATASPPAQAPVVLDYLGNPVSLHIATKAELLAKQKADLKTEEQDHSHLSFHSPRVWGPAAWFYFHTLALAQEDDIKPEQQDRLRRFFTRDLPIVLPCPQCGANAKEHISSMESAGLLNDATFSSRSSVAKFVWTLHNMVNTAKNVSHVSYDRSVLNMAQAYQQGATLLHFHDSDVEVTQSEHDHAELLMTPRPAASKAPKL